MKHYPHRELKCSTNIFISMLHKYQSIPIKRKKIRKFQIDKCV